MDDSEEEEEEEEEGGGEGAGEDEDEGEGWILPNSKICSKPITLYCFKLFSIIILCR